MVSRDLTLGGHGPNGEVLLTGEYGRWMRSISSSATATYNTRIRGLPPDEIAR